MGRIGSSIVSHWKKGNYLVDAVRSWMGKAPYMEDVEDKLHFWKTWEKLYPISNVLNYREWNHWILHTTKFWTCCLKMGKTLNKICNQGCNLEYKMENSAHYWREV